MLEIIATTHIRMLLFPLDPLLSGIIKVELFNVKAVISTRGSLLIFSQ